MTNTAISSVAAPPSHTRRVLLAVTGLSPQVITETIYALATRPTPWIPTEIHVITTLEGAKRVRLALLSEDPGWFHRLCRDYKLPAIAFTPEHHIHVLTAQNGTPLDDIRQPEDNEAAADFITEMVRSFTADSTSALHVSIAGGRKTMGYYLGYALSLYGRSQDRLSHVLVSEPFESNWEFFYPTPYSRVLISRDNKLADTQEAVVTLADIPFVSLRHELPSHLLGEQAHFSRSVAAARAALAGPSLRIDLSNRRIQAAGCIVSLRPAALALLTLFARRVLANEPSIEGPNKHFPDQAWAKRFLAEYHSIRGVMGDTDATERTLAAGMDNDYFQQHLSHLHRQLQRAMGASAARPYLIQGGKTRPRRYCLDLPPEVISFGSVAKDKL